MRTVDMFDKLKLHASEILLKYYDEFVVKEWLNAKIVSSIYELMISINDITAAIRKVGIKEDIINKTAQISLDKINNKKILPIEPLINMMQKMLLSTNESLSRPTATYTKVPNITKI